jgi:hypothetical protein
MRASTLFWTPVQCRQTPRRRPLLIRRLTRRAFSPRVFGTAARRMQTFRTASLPVVVDSTPLHPAFSVRTALQPYAVASAALQRLLARRAALHPPFRATSRAHALRTNPCTLKRNCLSSSCSPESFQAARHPHRRRLHRPTAALLTEVSVLTDRMRGRRTRRRRTRRARAPWPGGPAPR